MSRARTLTLAAAMLTLIGLLSGFASARAATILVPDDYSTIQQAIDAASPGDTIHVRPGTYPEALSLYKSITLQALSFNPEDPTQNTSIIDSGPSNIVSTIFIPAGVSPMPAIRGFVIRHGADAIELHSEALFEANYLVGGNDQIDVEQGGGGTIRKNVFFASNDDAIDLDDLTRPLLIEANRLMYSGDDGIEIRLQDDTAPSQPITTTIRNNEIIGCDEDGIQFIDYSQSLDTNRRFVITRNLIANCQNAGIGTMPNGVTDEDYSGADVIEPIFTYNNTIFGNNYGISGGDNHVVFNNIIANSSTMGAWRVSGQPHNDSIMAYTLFFNNGSDAQQSDLGEGNITGQDPLFAYPPNPGPDNLWYTADDDFSGLQLLQGSPAIDAGVTQYITRSGEAVPSSPMTEFTGAGMDFGWVEFDSSLPPTATPTSPPPGYGMVVSQIERSSDDAEEDFASGDLSLTSSDLELCEDNGARQWVGMRFNDITIPYGAYVISARIQLTVDDPGSEPTSVTLFGQATDHATAFSDADFDLSSRPRTSAQVVWNDIPPWDVVGQIQETTNLSSIVQEIIDRPSWVSGNSIAILVNGAGERTAESFDGEAQSSPRILIEYTTGDTPTPTPQPLPTSTPTPTPTPTVTYTPPPPGTIRFAIIGDYGSGSLGEQAVADLAKSWNPDFVLTTGDNNYPLGELQTIDHNIGQFYHEFIYPYLGSYGQGADINRFFPTLGNHDWETNNAKPYLDYFTLPGNERYYHFAWGPAHFFAIDSDEREPDGRLAASIQGTWLQTQLATSDAAWNVVYMHHPPYSSSAKHGSSDDMRWPYRDWGADAVLAGHDHVYERLLIEGMPYFVNGVGGSTIYSFGQPLPGSQVRYNNDFGAMLVEADETYMSFRFITRTGEVIDTFTLRTESSETPTTTPAGTATPTSTSTNSSEATLTTTSTATSIPSETSTGTQTPTNTSEAFSSPTVAHSATPNATASPTQASTDAPTPTQWPTATHSATATRTPAASPTVSLIPSATGTAVPTLLPTSTSTPSASPSTTETKVPTGIPTPTVSVLTAYAVGEENIAGTVRGGYSLTYDDDGETETITERLSGGKPVYRYSYLEHKWIFSVPSGNSITLYVNSWSSGSTDQDSFVFAYSVDNFHYTDMFTVTSTSDGQSTEFVLPPTIQGNLYLRLRDSDRSIGAQALDTVYIDQLFIRSEAGTGDPPVPPSYLSAWADSPSQVQLSWIDESDNEYGFFVERSSYGSDWVQIDALEKDTNTYTDANLYPNTTYYHRVRAFNASGTSDYSNVASATTLEGLNLTAVGYKVKAEYRVDLTWSGGSASAYDLYRDSFRFAEGIAGDAHTDIVGTRGVYDYHVCETGAITNCSPVVRVDSW